MSAIFENCRNKVFGFTKTKESLRGMGGIGNRNRSSKKNDINTILIYGGLKITNYKKKIEMRKEPD